ARGQAVLDVPGHDDRAIVLDMLGQRGLAPALDRLAQARHAHAGRERRAEADLLDKPERGVLAADAAMGEAAEMVVAMALERIERRRRGTDPGRAGHPPGGVR